MFFKSQFMFVLFAIFLVCAEESDVNYENLRRFMSQSPEDLAKTLQLLENPYIAAALVNGDKKQRLQPNTPPMEESNNLLNFLLSQRGAPGNSNTKYKVEKPPLPFVPPVVHAKEIENDPLLGSFFQNTMEDQAPLEVSVVGFLLHCVSRVELLLRFGISGKVI